MTGSGDVTKNFERAGDIAPYVSDCHEENHDGVSRLSGIGGRGSADDALEVCAFKVPASAVGGPDLVLESMVGNRKSAVSFLPFLR